MTRIWEGAAGYICMYTNYEPGRITVGGEK